MPIVEADPKGVIRESFAIEGISEAECRSIFLDWALSLAAATDPADALRALLAEYGADAPDHPMTRILAEGLTAPPKRGRRGGRLGRQAGL